MATDVKALADEALTLRPELEREARNRTATAKGFTLTDLGNAQRLVARHGHRIRYVRAWGRWLVWDGKRWAVDETGEVERLAKDTVCSIYAEASGESDAAKRKKVADWAKRSESATRIRAMLDLARSEEGVPVKPSDLDADPWLLNVDNGVLDLRTQELLPHDRDRLITKLAPVEFDPQARAPRWEAFIARVTGGDQGLADYLRRAGGYSLTGLVREQVMFFLWGGGRNGKSTFIETVLAVQGDYGIKAPSEMLMTRPGGIPNDLARLPGRRFVVCQETEDGQRLAEARVKDLTGGDRITARFLHQEFFEFQPSHKLWVYGNHRPVIRGTDDGIWRRIRLIPFTVQIPKEEVDPELPAKLREELPGILTWLVQGCAEWQQQGLGEAQSVEKATAAYRSDMDLVSEFVQDCCTVEVDARVEFKDLYRAYKAWAEEYGLRPMSGRAFAQRLEQAGFAKRRSNGRIYRLGLALSEAGQGRASWS